MPQRPATTEPHWRVYPVGPAGEFVNAAINALLPFLVGIGAAFVLLLAIGFVGEEGLLDDPGITAALDQLTRAAMIPVLVLALGIGVLTTILFALREVITSRAIARAATQGAPKTAVPHPSQVDLVAAERPFAAFFIGSIILAGVGLLFTVIAAFSVNSSEMPILWGSLAATGVAALFVLLALVGRPAQRRRRLAIAAHWTTADERAAWKRAAPASSQKDGESGLSPELQRRKRMATRCEFIGIVCFALGFSLLELWLFVTHPFRSATDAGPRVEHADGVEAVLDIGIWIFAALMVAAVALAVAGFVAESAVQQGEQQILRQALETPTDQRPPKALLWKYAQRQPVALAQGLALLAALGVTLGWAVYSLGTGGMEDVDSLYGDADETFGGFVPQALVTLAGSVAVVIIAIMWNIAASIRGYELRSQVVERWPIKPAPRMVEENGKKKPDPASIGPSLTPKQQTSQQ